jgi:hypothetical protein
MIKAVRFISIRQFLLYAKNQQLITHGNFTGLIWIPYVEILFWILSSMVVFPFAGGKTQMDYTL